MDNLALPPEVLTLTHQLEAAKLEEANTQLEACRRENELLKNRLEKSERDTHEFVAFFQREVGGKDTLLKKAQKRVEELEQLREKENKANEKKYRERERELTTELNALQESSSKEITFLKDDLRRFKNFKNARDELEVAQCTAGPVQAHAVSHFGDDSRGGVPPSAAPATPVGSACLPAFPTAPHGLRCTSCRRAVTSRQMP